MQQLNGAVVSLPATSTPALGATSALSSLGTVTALPTVGSTTTITAVAGRAVGSSFAAIAMGAIAGVATIVGLSNGGSKNEVNKFDIALAKIGNSAEDGVNNIAPNVQDYNDIDVGGVNSANLAAINSAIKNCARRSGDLVQMQ